MQNKIPSFQDGVIDLGFGIQRLGGIANGVNDNDVVTVGQLNSTLKNGKVSALFLPINTVERLTGAGAVSLETYKTDWTTTGVDAATLADGTTIGMLKKIRLIVDGGDGTLTPDNFSGATSIIFSEVGDEATLIWDGSTWVLIETSNVLGNGATPVTS